MKVAILVIAISLSFCSYSFAQNTQATATIPGANNETNKKVSMVVEGLIDEGISYRLKGDHKKAIEYFNKAIEMAPDYAEGYECRALSYGNSAMAEYDKSLADFNTAIKLDPKNKDFYFGRALIYYYKKDFNKTWADVHKAEELGFEVPPDFLSELKNASGRKN